MSGQDRQSLTLLSCAGRPPVWVPLAVGALASCAVGWFLFGVSAFASFESRAPYFVALAWISAAAGATSGIAWIRCCIATRPACECGNCRYDLRASLPASAPCPECGSELRRTEVRAIDSAPLGVWMLLPGVLLIVGALACAGYATLLGALLANDGFE